jgi:hypothetical protein
MFRHLLPAAALAVSIIAGAALLGPATAQESAFDLPGAATPAPPRPGIEGVVFVDISSAAHTVGPVAYDPIPPAGGPHHPAWQSCAFYDEPVPDERAVHSLEHGAVWITYQADIPNADLKALRQLAKKNDYLLVSPYEGLEHPIVASAWGAQLSLETASDPRLAEFIAFYANSPDGPEYGAPCTGGIEDTDPLPFAADATPMAQSGATPVP